MNEEAAIAAMKALCDTVEATGGLIEDSYGSYPAADPDWADLADAYLMACKALDRKPTIEVKEEDEPFVTRDW